jgi:hypothetical protein
MPCVKLARIVQPLKIGCGESKKQNYILDRETLSFPNDIGVVGTVGVDVDVVDDGKCAMSEPPSGAECASARRRAPERC